MIPLLMDSPVGRAMSKPRDDRQDDLFRPPLEEIINLRHPLVRLAREVDWEFVARRFGSACRSGPGQPPLPTRLVNPKKTSGRVHARQLAVEQIMSIARETLGALA